MSKIKQKQPPKNFVIQINYPKEEIPVQSTIIVIENCSLSPRIMFDFSWNIYKWNCTEYSILCLTSFTRCNIFEILTYMYYANHTFWFWAVFNVWTYHILFLCFSLERMCKSFWGNMFLFLVENDLEVEFLGNSTDIFEFIRKVNIYSYCIILYSHSERTWLPVFLPPHRHLILPSAIIVTAVSLRVPSLSFYLSFLWWLMMFGNFMWAYWPFPHFLL